MIDTLSKECYNINRRTVGFIRLLAYLNMFSDSRELSLLSDGC